MATTSSTFASSPPVTVTADGLAHALDKMGLTESVSAALLYDTILQLQSQTTPGPGDAIPQTTNEASPVEHRRPSWLFNPRPTSDIPPIGFFDPVRVEERRKMREMMKAAYPNGPP